MLLLACFLLFLWIATVLSATEAFAPSTSSHASVLSALRTSSIEDIDVRLLGRGPTATVRPGIVLLSPKDEFNHYLRRAAVFIYGMGIDDFGEEAIRGVIVDQPTPFTMGEMTPNVVGMLASNLLWRGGNSGKDSALLLHACGGDDAKPVGDSGIYEGGLDQAMDLCNEGLTDASQYKFFFNFCQFSPTEMEQMLNDKYEDGDGWMSLEVPPHIILSDDYGRGDCWKYLRKVVRERFPNEPSESEDNSAQYGI